MDRDAIATVDAEECTAARRGPELILWPQPDGTSRTIEADAIRALVGYVEMRDNA